MTSLKDTRTREGYVMGEKNISQGKTFWKRESNKKKKKK